MGNLGKLWGRVWPALVLVGFRGGIIIIPIAIDKSSTSNDSTSSSSYSSQPDDSTGTDNSYEDTRGSSDCISDCSGHEWENYMS